MPPIGLKSDDRRARMERDAKRMLLEYNKETKRLDDLYRCADEQRGSAEQACGADRKG